MLLPAERTVAPDVDQFDGGAVQLDGEAVRGRDLRHGRRLFSPKIVCLAFSCAITTAVSRNTSPPSRRWLDIFFSVRYCAW